MHENVDFKFWILFIRIVCYFSTKHFIVYNNRYRSRQSFTIKSQNSETHRLSVPLERNHKGVDLAGNTVLTLIQILLLRKLGGFQLLVIPPPYIILSDSFAKLKHQF